MATIKKACKGVSYPKSSSVSRRLKTGGSFPDLNKDGKITKKDVLIGRGVLPKTAKKGMKVKKAQIGTAQSSFDYRVNGPKVGPLEVRSYNVPGAAESRRTSDFINEQRESNRTAKRLAKIPIQKGGSSARPLIPKKLLSSFAEDYKKGGSVKKSAPKKMMMKTGGKMKKCAYGCK